METEREHVEGEYFLDDETGRLTGYWRRGDGWYEEGACMTDAQLDGLIAPKGDDDE